MTGKAQPRTYRCGNCGGPVKSHPNNSLGTWKCEKGCPKRRVTTTRFSGSGAENTRSNTLSFTRECPQPVVVTLIPEGKVT
jgi:hypothetical protein